MLKKALITILINTIVLVIIAHWIPQGGLTITPLSRSATPFILLLGVIFTLIYNIARPILKFLTTPINRMTLGIASIILNVIILYAFPFIINMLGIGITISVGSIEQVFILSILIALLTLILKKILL